MTLNGPNDYVTYEEKIFLIWPESTSHENISYDVKIFHMM